MRTLSSSLKSAQKARSVNGLHKLILYDDDNLPPTTNYGFDRTRIIEVSEVEEDERITAQVTLSNHDKHFNNLDFKGYRAELSFGCRTGAIPATWLPSTAYSLGDLVRPTAPNGYSFVCMLAGTSGSEPGNDVDETLRPNAAGDETAIEGQFPDTGEEHWENVDDVSPDDGSTTVNNETDTYQRDLYNIPPSSIGLGKINKITVYFRCGSSVLGSNAKAKASIKSNSTVTDGDEESVPVGSFQTFSMEWSTNPADSQAWEWSDIDGLQIGVSIKAGTIKVTCTQVYVLVNYRDSSGWPTELGELVSDSGVGWACNGAEGDEYSPIAPFRCISQQFVSSPDGLLCILGLSGVTNMMDDDEANADYKPDDDDTRAVRFLIDLYANADEVYSHCEAFDAVFDIAGGVASLLNDFIPKDGFGINRGDSRLETIKKLLLYTERVVRPRSTGARYSDAKIYVFKPTTTGTTYDYEYKLSTGEHTFFNKAYRERLVIPNYVKVESHPSHGTYYNGYATDATSYALMPKRKYVYARLQSDQEGTDIATAMIHKLQMGCEAGAAVVPMNCGAELWDYVKVTDERENKNKTGNIGYIRRLSSFWPRGTPRFEMEFRFGTVKVGRSASSYPAISAGRESELSSQAILSLIGRVWRVLEDIVTYLHYLEQNVSHIIWKATSEQALSDLNRTTTITWTDLDLTSYTSSDAKFAIVKLHILVDSITAPGSAVLAIRRNGDTPSAYPIIKVSDLEGDIAAAREYWTGIIGLDSNKKMEYQITISGTIQVDTYIDVLGYIE